MVVKRLSATLSVTFRQSEQTSSSESSRLYISSVDGIYIFAG